ncbi:MAG: hypothetical protein MUQ30_03530, partial [Anaerolineae bacterium]|nr:hypothetical protein [Anaerolineae bacterium]
NKRPPPKNSAGDAGPQKGARLHRQLDVQARQYVRQFAYIRQNHIPVFRKHDFHVRKAVVVRGDAEGVDISAMALLAGHSQMVLYVTRVGILDQVDL